MIKEIYADISSQKKFIKKGLFKSKLVETPMYEEKYKYTQGELDLIEQQINTKFPKEIHEWLLLAGCGAISKILLIGDKQYIYRFEGLGNLDGYINFACDDLGNQYAFRPNGDQSIFYVRHALLGYAKISNSFSHFLTEFQQANFEIEELTDHLKLIEIDEQS